jgi:galactokinase
MKLKLPDLGSEVDFGLGGELSYSANHDYFRSCINVLQRHGYRFSSGYDCVINSDIPINAGTSSSSALTVSWLHFLSLVSDTPTALSTEGIGRFAYEAEVLEFSGAGGMMDQYSTAFGGLIFLESNPHIAITPLKANLGQFVLGNSLESKPTQGILARVKSEITQAATAARRAYPDFSYHKTSMDELHSLEYRLEPRQFAVLEATFINRDLTLAARDVLLKEDVDHQKLGHLLTRHQEPLRDALGISTPKIDLMIEHALKAGALGAKINGSGGGGCMFAYAPDNAKEVAEAVGKLGEAMIITVDEGTRRESGNA